MNLEGQRENIQHMYNIILYYYIIYDYYIIVPSQQMRKLRSEAGKEDVQGYRARRPEPG